MQRHAQRTELEPLDLHRIGVGYMARIVLPSRFPDLVASLGSDLFESVAKDWAREFLAKRRRDSRSEVSFRVIEQTSRTLNPLDDFRSYVSQCHVRSGPDL
jgi:hypothetical protein